MTTVVDFVDSIGIGPMDVWVQVEITEAEPEVGLKADYNVLAVVAVDEETGCLRGVDMCGSYGEEQHLAWHKRAALELERKRRQAAEDAAIDLYEAERDDRIAGGAIA